MRQIGTTGGKEWTIEDADADRGDWVIEMVWVLRHATDNPLERVPHPGDCPAVERGVKALVSLALDQVAEMAEFHQSQLDRREMLERLLERAFGFKAE